MKTKPSFYSQAYLDQIQQNVEKFDWAKKQRQDLIHDAQPWRDLSYEEIWEIPFSPTLRRSHMVLSDGECPVCKKSVPMYEWQTDPFAFPWKVRCPHCGELFPKNDFYTYYKSGLDRKGYFRYDLADDSLLVPEDGVFTDRRWDIDDTRRGAPYYNFMDDGLGNPVDWCGQRRRYFIGAYLVFGQWKQKVMKGLMALSGAYLMTGDREYSRRIAILLDRIADYFPDYNYRRDGLVYEQPGDDGYVVTWHDSNIDVTAMAFAYDSVFTAIQNDEAFLTGFLAPKAEAMGLDNPKRTASDITRNIDERIFMDALKNPSKVILNYPGTDVLMVTIMLLLDPEGYHDEIFAKMGSIIQKSTAVDGVTGEKGLGGYANFTIDLMFRMFETLGLVNQQQMEEIIRQYPGLINSLMFYVDTWFLDKYTPQIGDTGRVGATMEFFAGFDFTSRFCPYGYTQDKRRMPILGLNMNTLLWKLYQMTGNEEFIKISYRKAEGDPARLAIDAGMTNIDAFYKKIDELKANNALGLRRISVNKKQWGFTALSAGHGDNERSVWMHYHSNNRDMHANHSHSDTMNIGLYAKGLDLMTDFGYPPVQYGGWKTKQVYWYMRQSAHNTVEVDYKGLLRKGPMPTTSIFGEQGSLQAVRANAPGYSDTDRYERSVAMIGIDDDDSYIFDVFNVEGGKKHAYFFHATYGTMTTEGLEQAVPAEDYHPDALYSQEKRVSSAPAGWSADWQIEDRYQVAGGRTDVHLKITALSDRYDAFTAKAWINAGLFNEATPELLDAIYSQHEDPEYAKSTFVSVIEPYAGSSKIASIERIAVAEPSAAAKITLTNGSVDYVYSAQDTIRFQTSAGEAVADGGIGLIRIRDNRICEQSALNGTLTVGK